MKYMQLMEASKVTGIPATRLISLVIKGELFGIVTGNPGKPDALIRESDVYDLVRAR